MLPSLNFDENDPKTILLGQIFKIIDSEKTKNIFNRNGVKQRKMMVICIKVFFATIYSDYQLSDVINELNRNKKLRKFFNIDDVPKADQVYEYLGRYNPIQYSKIVNSILISYHKPKRGSYNTFIADATPVACEINISKEYITDKHLKKLGLKWSYSTTKGHFIGFKVTVVLDKDNMVPVSILIHSGAPNDSRLFEEILKELRRRRNIKEKDLILFDKGYYSLENYLIGINKFKIVPIIFPRKSFDKQKFLAKSSYPLSSFNEIKNLNKEKKLINSLNIILLNKLDNWKDLKPIRGLIEDFFKAAKGAFNLGEFHSYTIESMHKNINLCILLTSLVVQQGYKTKTLLQQLAEGNVSLKENKKTKKKNSKKNDKKKDKPSSPKPIEQQLLEIIVKEKQSVLENFSKI